MNEEQKAFLDAVIEMFPELRAEWVRMPEPREWTVEEILQREG